MKNNFFKHIEIKNKDRKTDADYFVYMLGMTYDLNFYYSFKYLKDNKIIEKMANVYYQPFLKDYYDEIKKYIEKEVNYVR